MSAGNLRLFVGAPVPDDHLEWVGEQLRPLRERWPQARWAPRENQHVTLKFLGSTPAGDLERVVDACRQAASTVGSTSLRLAGLGAFPNRRRARVLWVGLEDPAGALATLAAGLDDAFRPLGYEAEKRAFSAHLTVARFKMPEPLDPLPQLADPPAAFPLEHLVLWRSHLSPKGARYEALERFVLGGE